MLMTASSQATLKFTAWLDLDGTKTVPQLDVVARPLCGSYQNQNVILSASHMSTRVHSRSFAVSHCENDCTRHAMYAAANCPSSPSRLLPIFESFRIFSHSQAMVVMMRSFFCSIFLLYPPSTTPSPPPLCSYSAGVAECGILTNWIQ